MIITREIIGKLEDWKNEVDRSPLVIQGARQIGKSWVVTEFGRTHYKHIAIFNFDKQQELKSIFESTKDVKRILGDLEHSETEHCLSLSMPSPSHKCRKIC